MDLRRNLWKIPILVKQKDKKLEKSQIQSSQKILILIKI